MLRSGRRHCCQQYVILAFQPEFDLTKLHFPFDSTLERHRGDKVSAFTWEIDHQSSILIARICRVRSTQIEHDFLSEDARLGFVFGSYPQFGPLSFLAHETDVHRKKTRRPAGAVVAMIGSRVSVGCDG